MDLEAENGKLKRTNAKLEADNRSLQDRLTAETQKSETLGSRIILAGQLLNDANHELDNLKKEHSSLQQRLKESTKKYEEEIEKLKAMIAERDSTIRTLNDKVDSLYVVSLEESQKKERLQERIKEMESQLNGTATSSPSLSESSFSGSSLLSSSAVYSVLSNCQEKMESMESELSEMTKECVSLRIENANLKQDVATFRKQYNDCLARESSLIQANRQLSEKFVSEIEKLDLSFSKVSEKNPSEATTYIQRCMEVTEQANSRLIALVKIFTGWDHLPPVGTEEMVSAMYRERTELIQDLSKERSQRREAESLLLDVQGQLRQAQIDYDRLVNPMEQVECAYAMQNETDLAILRDALNEKLGHLQALGSQLELMRETDSKNQQQLKKNRKRTIELEEENQALKATATVNENRIELLEKDAKDKEEKVHSVYRANKRLALSSQQLELAVREKESHIASLEEQIQTLSAKAFSSDAVNELKKQVKQYEKEVNQSKSDQSAMIALLDSVCNNTVMCICALNDTCKTHNISPASCEALEKEISHLGTITTNGHFVEDVQKIINDATALSDTELLNYLEEREKYFKEMKDEMETSKTELRDTYQKQIELMKERLQQMEDFETGTMKTMISRESQDMSTSSGTMLSVMQQNDILNSKLVSYQEQVDKLMTSLKLLDPFSPNAYIIGGNNISEQLKHEKIQHTLWQIRSEQLEMMLSENQGNRSCLTDYELSILSSMINTLLDYVMNNLVLDLELDISFESLEKEYYDNVRQLENREALLIEMKLYAIHRIVECAVTYLLNEKYQMEMNMADSHDRICELEYALKKSMYTV